MAAAGVELPLSCSLELEKREMEEAVKEGETLFCQQKSRMQSIRPVAHVLCVAHTPRLPVMLVQSTLV